MSTLAALSLSETEILAFLVLAASELHDNVAVALDRLGNGNRSKGLERLVYGDRWTIIEAFRELGPKGALTRLGLVDDSVPGRPSASATALDWLLAGETSVHVPETAFVGDQRAIDSLERALGVARAVVILCGPVGSGRRTLACAVASGLMKVSGRQFPKEEGATRDHLRALGLECRLTGKTPLLCNLDALSEDKLAIVANDFAPLIEGTILVTCTQKPAVPWDRPVVVIEMGQPTHAQRAALWLDALGQGTEADGELLAGRYPLAPALIVRAAEAAKARAAGREVTPEDIYAGIRAVLDDKLGAYARRVTITQSWDDVVLPADQRDSIVELMARVRGRHQVYEQWGFGPKVGKGLGVSALFSGPPGTGKTMVAGLIAKELGLELYQVDMAKIVSKFIGETEKNLAALFAAAEAGHAILLFDEADALFGKRTEVKSSNDRFANFETNYLLQRLETFTGICLLTTNHESNMDPAFQRRLSLHLRFELPDADERASLWRAVLPAGAPIEGTLDFAGLGRRFAMSGGYIKNAALRAAFLAADRGDAIAMADLERAARVELEGMGRVAA